MPPAAVAKGARLAFRFRKKGEKRKFDYRIKNTAASLIMSAAAIADMLQAAANILWVTAVLGLIAWGFALLLYAFVLFVIIIIFFACRVNPFFGNHAGRKLVSLLFSMTMELLPIASTGPFICIWAWKNIILSRQEDREDAVRSGKIQGGGKGALVPLPVRVAPERTFERRARLRERRRLRNVAEAVPRAEGEPAVRRRYRDTPQYGAAVGGNVQSTRGGFGEKAGFYQNAAAAPGYGPSPQSIPSANDPTKPRGSIPPEMLDPMPGEARTPSEHNLQSLDALLNPNWNGGIQELEEKFRRKLEDPQVDVPGRYNRQRPTRENRDNWELPGRGNRERK